MDEFQERLAGFFEAASGGYHRKRAEEMRRLAIEHEIAVSMENARGGCAQPGDYCRKEFEKCNSLANNFEFAKSAEMARNHESEEQEEVQDV